MHRPSTARLAMLAASFGAMMKAATDASVEVNKAAEAFSLEDFQKSLAGRGYPVHHPAQGSHTAFLNQESRRPSPDYIRRQRIKTRWENGLPVAKADADALEAAAARRAPILARRAKMYASGMKVAA